MNVAIQVINGWGDWFASVSFGMLVQSSVLIILLASIDWLLRNKARAIVRYSLWMLLLLKLVLPVNLSLPTSMIQISPVLPYPPPAHKETSLKGLAEPTAPMALSSDTPVWQGESLGPAKASGGLKKVPTGFVRAPEKAELSASGWWLLSSLSMSLVLLAAVVWRNNGVSRFVRSCPRAEELTELLESCCAQLGIRRRVDLRVAEENLTPALCGIVRPCILLPRFLATTLERDEIRAVLLHELAHLKRGDLLVNLVQTILQIVFFYHPLLWLANARIRRLREQSVDELVLVTMGNEADVYPATLVNVAKFALNGRAVSFGTVGIMESKNAFASRIRRMVAQPFPSSTRLGVTSIAAMVAIGLCVLPMAGSDAGKEINAPAEFKPQQPALAPNNSLGSGIHAKSIEELFAQYDPDSEHRKRSQMSIASEIVFRATALEFLMAKLQKDISRPEIGQSIQVRKKAALLIGRLGSHSEPAVPLLMECLEDDEEVRQAATRALGDIGPAAKMAIPILKEELQFQNTWAGSSLAKIAPQSKEVVNAMLAAIVDSSKNEQFRQQVMFALQNMTVRTPGYAAAIDELADGPEGTLKDTALQMKGVAVKPRYSMGDPSEKYKNEDLGKIIELIRGDPQDYAAWAALRRFGTNATPALPTLIEVLESKRARFPGNVVGAISALGPSASNAVPVLLRCLDEDDQSLVHNTLSALGRIGPAAISAKPRLIEFLDDSVPALRWVAADSLRRIDSTERDRYVPVLLEPVKSGRYTEHFAEVQIRVLSELGDYARPYIPKLRQMLDQRESLRIVAAEVLLVLDPSAKTEVVRAMIRMLDDEAAMNPQLAAMVLGKVGPSAKDALPSLRKLAADETPWKAESARNAISKIESKSL